MVMARSSFMSFRPSGELRVFCDRPCPPSFVGQLFESLAKRADDPVLFDEQGQVGHRLVQSKEDDAQLIQSGVHGCGHRMEVRERRHPCLAREDNVANRLVAEVVDALALVDSARSLEQVQRLPTKTNPRMTLIQQALNRINAFVCGLKICGGFIRRLRSCVFSIKLLLVAVGVHVTILVRLWVGRIQKSGMS